METESQDISTKDKFANSDQSQTAKFQGSPRLPCPVNKSNSTFHPQNRNRFTETYVGIAKMFIQWIQDFDKGNDDLHPISLGRVLNRKYNKAICDVRRSGTGKLAVFLRSAKEANKLLDDRSFLSSSGLSAFVPLSFISSQGVIRDVPLDVSDHELLKKLEVLGCLQGKISVMNVRRLNKRFFDKDTKSNRVEPSCTILITFHGQDRPDKISLFGVSKVVKDYVPQPRMCLNCMWYGHINAYCRSKTQCKQCGGLADHKEENPCPNENSPPKCATCEGPHLPNSKDCPELGFQKELRAYATRNRVTFAEAKSFLRPPKNQKNEYPPNPNSQPPSFSFSNFHEFAEVPAPGTTNFSNSQTYVEALKNFRNSATPKPIKYQNTSVANSNGSFRQKKPRQTDLSSYYSLINNGRTPSSLPRGFALNKPATGSAPLQSSVGRSG